MEKHRNKVRIQVVYAVYQNIITEILHDVWQRQFLRIEPNQTSTVLRKVGPLLLEMRCCWCDPRGRPKFEF